MKEQTDEVSVKKSPGSSVVKQLEQESKRLEKRNKELEKMLEESKKEIEVNLKKMTAVSEALKLLHNAYE